MARVTNSARFEPRSRQALAAANRRMKHDLVAAAKIQQAFLPTDGGAGFGGRVLRGAILPCDELAGDTLNILPLDDNHVACFVVDVRGHGVPAVAALGNPEPADVGGGGRVLSPFSFCGFTTTHDPSRGSPHPSRSPILSPGASPTTRTRLSTSPCFTAYPRPRGA